MRVPALVVGPRVPRQVCHQQFDHTSLIKTILLRFASDPDHAISQMGPRVQHAQHLGVLLNDTPRTDIPDHDDTRQQIAAWREQARSDRRGTKDHGQSLAPDGAGHPMTLHEFQEDFLRFALAMRFSGLPHGEP